MTITNTAKNRIRDLIADDISTGALGTGTTSPTVNDTDLENKDTSTENSVTIVTGDRIVNVNYLLDSITGNGNDYTEFAVYFSDGTLLDRVIFPSFSKTDSTELHITDIIIIQ